MCLFQTIIHVESSASIPDEAWERLSSEDRTPQKIVELKPIPQRFNGLHDLSND